MTDISHIASNPSLTQHIDTLKELSIDDSKNEYVTDSKMNAIGFDDVKKDYIASLTTLKLTDSPCSIDAICLFKDKTLAFIEFKNGKLQGKEVYELRKKVYDSLLIFNDLTSVQISDLRASAALILVFRKDINPSTEDDLQSIQESPSREKIANHVSMLAKTEIIQFGLSRFESYCFKEVHTYSPKEFETYLKNKDSLI